MTLAKKTALIMLTILTTSSAWASGNAIITAGVNKILATTGVPSVSQPFTIAINPQTGIITPGTTAPIAFSPPITVFSNDASALIKISTSGQLNYSGATPITSGFTGTIAYSDIKIFGRTFQANGAEQTQPLGAIALSTENIANAPVLTLQSSDDVPVAGSYSSVINIEVISL